ncbi:MAG: ArsR family transcriptional regulator, arsenate/arsenite/antimonite-responsive transcriptional [Chloroflexia bacterium]|jgi:DNA-binding transcriptional ArsR family regulator|nr:ArsR family transcriptional regulator, arsenate/arsenite/antimonite-responsive transcriptional [Chloroflexia bacterium]
MTASRQNNRERTIIPLQVAGCCDDVVIAPKNPRMTEQVRLLSALADPTRLRIVEMLSGTCDSICVCDITTQFDLGQPTISHHLKVLRDANLVSWEKRGLWVYYSLNRDAFEEVAGYLNGLLSAAQLAGAQR